MNILKFSNWYHEYKRTYTDIGHNSSSHGELYIVVDFDITYAPYTDGKEALHGKDIAFPGKTWASGRIDNEKKEISISMYDTDNPCDPEENCLIWLKRELHNKYPDYTIYKT